MTLRIGHDHRRGRSREGPRIIGHDAVIRYCADSSIRIVGGDSRVAQRAWPTNAGNRSGCRREPPHFAAGSRDRGDAG